MIEKLLALAPKSTNRNCTFLYRSTLGYISFLLCYRYLCKPKTLPHEFFTKIGHIDNVENLQAALGTGNVSVTFSVPESSDDEPLRGDVNGDGEVNIGDVTTLIDIILGKED